MNSLTRKEKFSSNLTETDHISWTLQERFRFMEVILYWEGRLTTNHLCDAFKIKRQQASKVFQLYKNIAPDNLIYDRFLKGHKPSDNFSAKFASGDANEYLSLLVQSQEATHHLDTSVSASVVASHCIQPPRRSVNPKTLRPIIRAIRNKERLEVDYISISSPNREGRIISPHTLVFNGLRWHVRAYCEKNQGFRDFVLSRFRSIPESLGPAKVHIEKDDHWNTELTLKLMPDSRLSPDQQEVLIEEYNMNNGTLEVKTNAALAMYVLQSLQVEHRFLEREPTAQQLILSNLDEIRPYLFNN